MCYFIRINIYKIGLVVLFTFPASIVFSQSISGKVYERYKHRKEPLPSAVVKVYQEGVLAGFSVSDMDGVYLIDKLKPGKYEMLVDYIGGNSIKKKSVEVKPNITTIKNFRIKLKSIRFYTDSEDNNK